MIPESIFVVVVENFRFDGRKLTSLLYHTLPKNQLHVFPSIHLLTVEAHIKHMEASPQNQASSLAHI